MTAVIASIFGTISVVVPIVIGVSAVTLLGGSDFSNLVGSFFNGLSSLIELFKFFASLFLDSIKVLPEPFSSIAILFITPLIILVCWIVVKGGS